MEKDSISTVASNFQIEIRSVVEDLFDYVPSDTSSDTWGVILAVASMILLRLNPNSLYKEKRLPFFGTGGLINSRVKNQLA